MRKCGINPTPRPGDRRLRHHGELLEARAPQADCRRSTPAPGEPFGPPVDRVLCWSRVAARQIRPARQFAPASGRPGCRRARIPPSCSNSHTAPGQWGWPKWMAASKGSAAKSNGHEPHAEIDRHVRMAREEFRNARNEPAGAESRQNRKVQHAACAGERDRLTGGVRQFRQGAGGPARRTCAPHRSARPAAGFG